MGGGGSSVVIYVFLRSLVILYVFLCATVVWVKFRLSSCMISPCTGPPRWPSG